MRRSGKAALAAALLAAAALPLAASEHDIAEWAIRSGGRVVLAGHPAPVDSALSLPAGDVHITGIDLTGTLITPDQLEMISGLTGLKELSLPGPIWNPASGSSLDANDKLKFLAGLTSLEKLSFSIHFLTNINIQDKGVVLLTGLANLRDFRCAQCRISKASLAIFPKLESLDLSLSSFNDAGMRGLASLHDLRRLNLRDTLVTGEGLRNLNGLTGLEELDLAGTHVTDAGLASLQNLKAMRTLSLLGSEVSDESAALLAGMTELRELNLYRSQVTNAGLAKLAALKNLEAIDLRYSRVTASGVQAFRAALPRCRVEFSGAEPVSQKGAAPKPNGTGDAALAAWVRAMGGKADLTDGALRTVSLRSTAITDAGLANLSMAAHVERVDLEGTEVGDIGLASLKNLSSLRELNLNQTTVSDNGLAALSGESRTPLSGRHEHHKRRAQSPGGAVRARDAGTRWNGYE
jgi:Leucine-rich repeat (LRR) protein